MSRTRSRTGMVVAGGHVDKYIGSTWNVGSSQPGLPETEHMTDTVEPSPPFTVDHSLYLQQVKYGDVTRVDASPPTPYHYGVRRLVNYYVVDSATASPSLPVSYAEWINKALSNINPNVPIVDVPLFISELRELPAMLQDVGKFLSHGKSAGGLARGNLEITFGWAPLVRDLNSLLHLTYAMEKSLERTKRFARTQKVGGKLGSYSHSWPTGTKTITPTIGQQLIFSMSTKANVEVWFSGKLEPNFTVPTFDYSPRAQIARALGLEISMSTIWEMIPWSWLVDYFATIGSFLEATRGTLPYKVSMLDIMVHQKIVGEMDLFSQTGFSQVAVSGSGKVTEYKLRSLFPYPTPNLLRLRQNPLMGHTGVLASLFISRFIR